MRRISLFIAVLAAVLALPGLVSAHAKLVSSNPEDGATLAAAPATITLTFDDELESEGAALVVTDASGAAVDKGDGGVDLGDTERKTMKVSLKDGLGAGSYTATWTVIGDDGHEITGAIAFAVGDAPVPVVTAPSDDHDDDAADAALPATGGANLPLWLAAVALAALGAGTLLRRTAR
jgi:methionine-rich copper-binding protein CopC